MRFRLGLMAIFVLSASASGQTWTAVVGGNWSTGANWAGGNPPASLPTTALTFNADGSVSYTATNDLGAFFLRSLTINSQGSGTIGIANAAGSSLNFAGTNPAITLRGPGPTLISGGTLNFTTTTTIADASDAEAPSRLTITSALSGTGNLEISRSQGGFLSETVLNPSANTHTGTIIQRFGTLTLGSASALGTSSLAIQTSGFGLDATGDLRASVATAISSPMTLTSGNLNVYTGADITIHSDLGGNGGIALGDGLNISTTDLTLNGNNSYIGQTRVLGGTLTVTNTIASSRITVGRFGTAVIGSATTFNSNRLNPLVNLDGGILNLVGNSTVGNNWSEDVTTLQIHGFSTIGIDGQSATSTRLNVDTMTRFLRGSLRVRGDAARRAPFGTAGSATIAVTNVGGNPISARLIGGGGAAGTTNISVLPFAVGSATLTGAGDSFVTVDGNGLRPLNTTTEYLNRLPTAPYLNSTTANYRLTTPMTSITQPTTVSALAFVGGGVYNTTPISVTSGAILSTATAHAGPLAFGSAEAHVTSSNGSLVLGSITGTNGLTVAGTGEVVVTNTSALSGQLTLNSGLLTLPGGGVLASGLAPLLAGGGISVRGFTEVLTNPISVSSVGGSVQMRPIGSSAIGTSTVLTLSGNISGTGGLFDIDGGGGRVELTGSNGAFNGIWQVSSGTLAVESQANLGTAAPVVLNGGTLAVTANISLQNRLILNASSTIFANTGGEVVLTSRLDGRTNSAGLTLLGATVAFEQPAVYRGATNIGVGGDSHAFGADVVVRGNSGRLLGTSSVTIQERGSLFVDNAARSAGVFTPRLSGFPVTLAGGQLNMSGGEAGSGSTEALGALTLAGNTSNQMNLRILTPGSPSPTFNFTSLTRQPGSTLVIDTTIASQTFLGVLGDAANGVGVVRFAQPPALINGILPGVFAKVGNSVGFLDHDIRLAVTPASTVGGVFVRDLRIGDPGLVFNNYGTSTSNAYFDDGLTNFPTNTRTINSLSIESGVIRINVGQTLTVASGMVAFQTISGFILAQDASADAGNLASPAGVDLSIGRPRQTEGGETIPGIITLVANLQPGSGTLNFAGDGRMRLVSDLSTVQRMNIHGGEIRYGTSPQNGTISPNMDLHVQDRSLFVVENVNVAIDELTGAGTINYDGIGEMTVGSANGSSTFNGSIGIAAGATFRKAGTGTFRIVGTFLGSPGSLAVTGGTMAFGPATNNVPATTRITGGTVSMSNNTSLLVDNVVSFERNISVLGNVTLGSGLTGTATTFVNPVTMFSGATLTVNAPLLGGFRFSGGFGGPGAVILDGGVTVLNAVSTNTGGTTIQSSQLTVIGVSNAFNAEPITLAGTPFLLPGGGNRTVNSPTTLTGNVTFGPSLGTESYSTGFGLNFNAGVGLAGSGNRTVTVTGTGNFQFSNVTGAATNGLTKAGGGLLTLNGTNSFAGPLAINAGTLHLAGSKTGTGLVTVGTATASAPMAVLSGVGPVAGNVIVRTTGVISPGSSAGILTVNGPLTFDAGSTYKWELAALSETGPGTNFDRIDPGFNSTTIAAGAVLIPNFIGTATMPNLSTPFWQTTRSWVVIDSSSLTSGTPFAIDNTAWAAFGSFESRFGASGGLLVRWAPVPEPAHVLLGCAGAGMLWRIVRRRRAAQ